MEGIDNRVLMHDSPFCGEPEPALPEQDQRHEPPQDLGRPILLESGGAVDKEGQNNARREGRGGHQREP